MLRHERLEWQPGAADLASVFRAEAEAAGGRVLDLLVDGDRLFARAVVPSIAGEVAPRDEVQGGVALRTKGPDVLVHPFVYRLVCKNGAIRAHATETRRVTRPRSDDFLPDVEAVLAEVRDALRAACGLTAFRDGLDEMRSAARRDADLVDADLFLSIASFLGAAGSSGLLRSSFAHALLAELDRISGEGRRNDDASLYGLMNAVTARARETRDPEQRWRLEELGGAIGARPIRPRPRREWGAALPIG